MTGRGIGGVICLVMGILWGLSAAATMKGRPGFADPSGLGLAKQLGPIFLRSFS